MGDEIRVEENLVPLIGGLYLHFKGEAYRVSDIATNAETGMTDVVYKDLKTMSTYTRSLDRWNEPAEGGVERYRYLGRVGILK